MTVQTRHALRSILLRTPLVALAFAGVVLSPAHLRASGALYTITDLGALNCCDSLVHASSALAVNIHGDVVGMTSSLTDPRIAIPFIYRNGTMTAITDNYGWATGINDAGQVTGFVLLPGQPNIHAFLYQDGVLTDLGGLPGFSNQPYAIGWAINNAE